MKIKLAASFLLLLLFVTQSSRASTNLKTLGQVLSESVISESDRAIAELRVMGPAGLGTLFQLHGEQINRRVSNP